MALSTTPSLPIPPRIEHTVGRTPHRALHGATHYTEAHVLCVMMYAMSTLECISHEALFNDRCGKRRSERKRTRVVAPSVDAVDSLVGH